jgi:hypothetical protein
MIAAGFIGLDSHLPYHHLHYDHFVIMSNFLTFNASVRDSIHPFRISLCMFDIISDRIRPALIVSANTCRSAYKTSLIRC